MATETGSAELNPLEMTDEDFLKMSGPGSPAAEPASAEGAQTEEEPKVEAQVETGDDTQPATEADDKIKAAEGADVVEDKTEGKAAEKTADDPKVETDPKAGVKADAKVDPKADPAAAPSGSPEGEAKPPNYEEFYAQVMAPFKANGKTIELRSPEEAIKLMQQGANYTRKLQEIVPHRKVLTMLQNNGLLDESKLSYLIDLDKKNPEAIKKLIKDSGIDPMEIDTSVEPAYLEGHHRVSDEEVNFKSALEELGSTPVGKETLQDINTRWDASSKELLWKFPETMAVIHAQREVGIYDRIVGEMDRQKTIGKIPPQTTFLEAYKIVGDELTAANAFADLVTQAKGSQPKPAADPAAKTEDTGGEPKPVATRAVTPKPQVTNDDKASAASSTRSSSKTAKEFVNPLAMSDDEFLKQFNGRL